MIIFQPYLTIFLGSPRGYHLVAHTHTDLFERFLLADQWVEIPYTSASVNFAGLVKAIKYTNWDPAFFYRDRWVLWLHKIEEEVSLCFPRNPV